ncbi:MAG: tyrosine recombinase XerC [Rhodoferax sp.]|nr:tyrosine recombinase XerC [Rhodoferax sp.]
MQADSALIEGYLEHVRVEKRLAARTVELYALDLAKLKAYAAAAAGPTGPGVALTDVKNHHIRRWVASMHSGGRSGRGIALILSGWRGFYGWLGRQGQVASNPVQDVRSPKAPKPLPKALGVDDAVQFADFRSDDDAWLEARDAAMVELLYGSGLRVGELVGLDVVASPQAKGWIDMQEAQAHVLGKGSKRRSVPVGAVALRALERWLALRGPGVPAAVTQSAAQEKQAQASAALFQGRHGTRLTAQSVWQRLQRRSLQAGMATPVHPHMLRHSFASHVLQSSSDLRGVQELLGHANISTTQVYTRLDFQHLAKAYDAAHPRAKAKKGGA